MWDNQKWNYSYTQFIHLRSINHIIPHTHVFSPFFRICISGSLFSYINSFLSNTNMYVCLCVCVRNEHVCVHAWPFGRTDEVRPFYNKYYLNFRRMQIECQIHTRTHICEISVVYLLWSWLLSEILGNSNQNKSQVYTRTHFFHHLSISHRWCHEKRINLLTSIIIRSLLWNFRIYISESLKLRSISICNRGCDLHSHLNLEMENTSLIFWKEYMLIDLLSICPVLLYLYLCMH